MEDTKRYICKLPTNGHEVGDEVFLTDTEVANANGGEAEPRYVLAEDQTVAETNGAATDTAETAADTAATDTTAATQETADTTNATDTSAADTTSDATGQAAATE